MKTLRSLGAALALAIMLTAAAYASVNDLPVTMVNGKPYHYYDVQPKETIYSLTHKLGVTREEIIVHNPSVADGLKAHSRLLFPASSAGGATHVVAKGETAYGISHRYGMSVDELLRMNPAAADGLKAGMVLKVKGAAAIEAPATAYRGYVVQGGETLYSIAKNNGVTVAELEAANPNLTVLKTGQVINIPVAAEVAVAPAPAGNEVETVVTPTQTTITDLPAPVVETVNATPVADPLPQVAVVTPLPVDTLIQAATEPEPAVEPEPEPEPVATAAAEPVKIGIVLPFMLNQPKMSKATAQYTEFYKGILLAADSLRQGGAPIRLYAFDTSDNADSLRRVIKRMTPLNLDMIVGPDDAKHLEMLGKWGRDHGVGVLNVFAVRDSSWIDNPVMMQANITHRLMYADAVKGFINNLGGATPVFVSRNGGATDKQFFVDDLKKALKAQGIKWIDITFNGKLEAANVAKLKRDGRYMVVPVSSKQNEFSNLFPGLNLLREETTAKMGETRLFGYPEWIAFRGESLVRLRNLDTMIFSRFYSDNDDYATIAIENKFKQWFGQGMTAAVPKQGILGFDTGMFMIQALRHTGGKFMGALPPYYGIQNGFDFVTPDGARGRVNDVLFLINFRPGGLMTRIVL